MSAPATKFKVRWAAVIVQLLTGVLLGMLAAWALAGGGIPSPVNEDGQGSDIVTLEGE